MAYLNETDTIRVIENDNRVLSRFETPKAQTAKRDWTITVLMALMGVVVGYGAAMMIANAMA